MPGHPRDGIEVVGTLKSFSESSGYGFISSAQVQQDIFLPSTQVPQTGGRIRPEFGRRLRCTLWHDAKGRPQARNVVWLAPEEPAEPQVCGGSFTGRLKSMGEAFGFIECDAFQGHRNDVFIRRAQLPEGCALGTMISFEVSTDGQGRPQAKNIKLINMNFSSTTLEHPATTDYGGELHLSTSTEGTIPPSDPMYPEIQTVGIAASRW